MKKFISILLCYCVLTLPTGCTMYKPLATVDAETVPGAQNYLILHTPTRNYEISNYKFTRDSIEGNLGRNVSSRMNTINIYTQLNFDIKLNMTSTKFIRISKSDISKISYRKFSLGNTILLIAGGAGAIAVLAAIVANSMSFNIDLNGF